MMRVLHLTAEIELGPWDVNETQKRWCVIKLCDYEIGRVEVGWSRHYDQESDDLDTAAAVWLAERLKA